MKEEHLIANGLSAVLYGESADKVWLYIHGRQGCKEEAADFAKFACEKNAQVLAIDLPGHGERKMEVSYFVPWCVKPELKALMSYAKSRWQSVSLRANSIGAWFSLLSFEDDALENCLFVSPVLDMEELIGKMMQWAGVSQEELQQRGTIPTAFGEDLSWDYLEYVRAHPIKNWSNPSSILFAGRDDLTERSTVEAFCKRFGCRLTVMEQGEHWFHTPEQLSVLNQWTSENC